MEVSEEIYDYYMDSKRYNKEDAFLEIKYRKSLERWNKILSTYQSLEIKRIKFEKLPLKEAKEIVLESMIEILGDSYREKLEEFVKKTVRKEGTDFHTTTEWNIVGNTPKLIKFHITDYEKSSSIWKMGHEYTHGFLLPFLTEKFNQVFGNIHYEELPSMFMERVVARKAALKIEEKDYTEKTEALRIKDTKSFTQIDTWKMLKNESSEIRKIYNYYFENQKICYILSDIYANRLVECYEESPKIVLEKYKLFLEGKLCLIDLLTYFGISLKDTDTYISYQKKLQNLQ